MKPNVPSCNTDQGGRHICEHLSSSLYYIMR